MKLVLPWWFPLPDAVVKATFQAGIRYMTLGLHCFKRLWPRIADGQAKISDAVTQRYQRARA